MTLPDGARPPAAEASVAARLAAGDLDDVPAAALAEGLRLPLHDFLGIELCGLRPVVVELALGDRTRSLGAPLHGGVVATLADVAGNIAAATSGSVDVTRHGLTTVRLDVELRAQPRGDRVRAEATVLEAGARTVRTRCEIGDSDGRRVAVATVTTRVVPRAGFPATGLGA